MQAGIFKKTREVQKQEAQLSASCTSRVSLKVPKCLYKAGGHNIAVTLWRSQLNVSLFAPRVTFAAGTKFVSEIQFLSETFCVLNNVFPFARPKQHHEQQCARNNVSSFATALTPQREGSKFRKPHAL